MCVRVNKVCLCFCAVWWTSLSHSWLVFRGLIMRRISRYVSLAKSLILLFLLMRLIPISLFRKFNNNMSKWMLKKVKWEDRKYCHLPLHRNCFCYVFIFTFILLQKPNENYPLSPSPPAASAGPVGCGRRKGQGCAKSIVSGMVCAHGTYVDTCNECQSAKVRGVCACVFR